MIIVFESEENGSKRPFPPQTSMCASFNVALYIRVSMLVLQFHVTQMVLKVHKFC